MFDFYEANSGALLSEVVKNRRMPEAPLYAEFSRRVAESGLFHNFNADIPLLAEFKANCSDGISEYAAAMGANPSRKEKRAAYNRYFTSPAARKNMKLLKANPREDIDKTKGWLHHDDLVEFLKKWLDDTERPSCKDPFTAPDSTPDCSRADAIRVVESLWNVSISRRISPWGWWHGFAKYRIRGEGRSALVWVADKYSGEDLTTQVGPRDSVSMASTNRGLAHELTHAVQFMYKPIWEWPEGVLEIPAMAAEVVAGGWDSIFDRRRQVALAYADLTCTGPRDFNKIFEAESGLRDVGLVSGRMWHYLASPRNYYSYALGLCYGPPSRSDVHDPEELRASVTTWLRKQSDE